VRWWWSWRR